MGCLRFVWYCVKCVVVIFLFVEDCVVVMLFINIMYFIVCIGYIVSCKCYIVLEFFIFVINYK